MILLSILKNSLTFKIQCRSNFVYEPFLTDIELGVLSNHSHREDLGLQNTENEKKKKYKAQTLLNLSEHCVVAHL